MLKKKRNVNATLSNILRGASPIALAISGLIGSWELGAYLKESWEIDQLAEGYAKVGIELYHEENNTTVAKKFMEKL